VADFNDLYDTIRYDAIQYGRLTSYEVFPHKDSPLGDFVDMFPHFGGQISKKNPEKGVRITVAYAEGMPEGSETRLNRSSV